MLVTFIGASFLAQHHIMVVRGSQQNAESLNTTMKILENVRLGLGLFYLYMSMKV